MQARRQKLKNLSIASSAMLKFFGARVLIFAVIFEIALPLPLLAQTYQEGYKRYSRGDFKGAEAAWQLASRKKMPPAERAKTLKFLGIARYMQKKTALATAAFRAALQINPRLTISSQEVLDEQVIPFFESHKRRPTAAKAPAARPAAKPPAPVARAAPLPAASTGSVGIPKTPRGGQPAKTTYLRVNSNVANATILMDGILAGNTGALIEAEPGVVEIQIDAAGYLSKKAKVRILPMRENTVVINLEKPKPKTKPAPPKKEGGFAGGVAAGATGKKAGKGGDMLPDPKADDLFGGDDTEADPSLAERDLQREFAFDATTAPYSAPPQAPVPQQPAPAAPYGAQPGYQQPGYGPQPGYPYPYPQQPMYPYPTQPYAPGYPPMPYGAQPYGMPYQPPMSPYAPAPPPPPMTPMDPNTGAPAIAPQVDYYDKGTESEDFLPPVKQETQKKTKSKIPRYQPPPPRKNNRGTNRRRSSSSSSSSSSGSGSILIALMPFGAGQFQNDSMMLGLAFGVAEVGALYWYYVNKTDADETVEAANKYGEETQCTDGDAEDNAKCEQDKQDYADQANVYVAEKRKNQYYGLYGFFGLWVIGAGEAIFNAPTPKKRPRRRLGLLELDPATGAERYALIDESTPGLAALDPHKKSNPLLPRVEWGIMFPEPDHETESANPKPHLGMNINWEF